MALAARPGQARACEPRGVICVAFPFSQQHRATKYHLGRCAVHEHEGRQFLLEGQDARLRAGPQHLPTKPQYRVLLMTTPSSQRQRELWRLRELQERAAIL